MSTDTKSTEKKTRKKKQTTEKQTTENNSTEKKNENNSTEKKSKVHNGKITDILEPGSLMHHLYSGMNPQSDLEYDSMRIGNTCLMCEKGIINYNGECHVFDKCHDEGCKICGEYKNKINYYKKIRS
jgi:hypothetical protein